VRRIFEMCAEGHGVKGIAKQLNAERLPSPRPRQGRPRSWTPSTVRTVLYRELYRGISIWNRRRQTDAWGQRKCERRPEEEWIRAEVPHLRIVTHEQWADAHRRLSAARQTCFASSNGNRWGRPPTGVQSKYLLTGPLRCACCGASMKVRSGTYGLGQRLFYVCASYNDRGSAICGNGLRLPMTVADDAVLTKLSSDVIPRSWRAASSTRSRSCGRRTTRSKRAARPYRRRFAGWRMNSQVRVCDRDCG
jgi:site-specific DNA recombinase